jgi:hypothetical protein
VAASITDDIKARMAHKGPTCHLNTWLQGLTPKRRTEFLEAMADRSITGTAITGWLKDQGLVLVSNTVAYHRRGECVSCTRSGYFEARP